MEHSRETYTMEIPTYLTTEEIATSMWFLAELMDGMAKQHSEARDEKYRLYKRLSQFWKEQSEKIDGTPWD